MMNNLFLPVRASAPILATVFLFACSSSDATPAKTDSGTPIDSSPGVDSSPGIDSSVSDANAEAGAAPDCTSYCTEVLANCTGAVAQYASMASCMNVCGAFPVGTVADKSGNTLGCRLYHGGAPSKGMPVMHCPHAGPNGGDKDPNGTAGTCGEPCDAFCAIAQSVCTGGNQQFASTNDCLTACKSFKVDVASYSTADTVTNDLGCRTYHLSVAATDAMSAKTHCPHIIAASTVCTN